MMLLQLFNVTVVGFDTITEAMISLKPLSLGLSNARIAPISAYFSIVEFITINICSLILIYFIQRC